MEKEEALPWYKDGLHFGCTGCGKCCTGSPGYIWITEEEMAAVAAHLTISLDTFKKNYTRQVGSRYSLLDLPNQNWDCIFLNGKECSIYSLRPTQCRTYPWWKDNLKSPQHWEQAAHDCEGIRDDAPVVPLSEILTQLRKKAL